MKGGGDTEGGGGGPGRKIEKQKGKEKKFVG